MTVRVSGVKADLISAIPGLRAFALALCGDADKADDLVQETLVRAYGSLSSFAEGTNLMAWLVTILRNAYYNERKKGRREVADPEGVIADSLYPRPPKTRIWIY